MSHFMHLMRINSLVEESHYLYQLMDPFINSSSAHKSLVHDEACGLSSLLLKQSTDFELHQRNVDVSRCVREGKSYDI